MAKTLATFVTEAKATVPEVDAERARAMLDAGEHLVLDVREPDEFSRGHIPGAMNVPRGKIEIAADHEHPDRDERLWDRRRKILCYCGGGMRSVLAARTLQEMGFLEALSLKGGYTEWRARADARSAAGSLAQGGDSR